MFPSPFCFVYLQLLEEWTTENIIDWMAAVNLARYAELFRERKLTGRNIICMNERTLLVSY